MKIFKTLFGSKKIAPAPAPALAPSVASSPAPIKPYYKGDVEMIRTLNSVEMLRHFAVHPSGYVREAVLRRCVELALPELLPIVAERLNDWVPQVQHAARRALMTLLPLVSAAQMFTVMPVILRLHSPGRSDYAAWQDKFEKTLIQAFTVDDLLAAANWPDIKVARASVYVLEKHRLLDTPALINLILARNDDIVLALRAVELCARLEPERQDAVYRAAARSHFGPVRTIAIRALLAMTGARREDIAIAALLDVQSSVRQVAISYLLAKGFDVQAYYRSMLEQETLAVRGVRVGLTALATLRDKADVALLKSFEANGNPSIRTAARAAWFKLAASDKDEIALAAMDDRAVGPRKFAIQLVHKHGAYIPFSAVLVRLEEGGDAAFLLRLVESGKWNWLECVARTGLLRGVEEARQLGLSETLAAWLNSTQWYDQPGKEQAVFLSSEPVITFFNQLLAQHPHRLAALLQQIRPQS